MSHLATTDTLFFERAGLDKHRTEKLVNDALKGADDGELFLEYTQSESLAFDDGRLKNASYDTMQGFGLRSVAGEAAGYAHSNELSEDAIKRAAGTVGAVHQGRSGVIAEPPIGTNRVLYGDDNPLGDVAFEDKVKLLVRDRRLRPGEGQPGQAGLRLAHRVLAGGADRPRRRPPRGRRPPAGPAQRAGRLRPGRPDGKRHARAPAGAPATRSTCSRGTGRRPSTRRCARRW